MGRPVGEVKGMSMIQEGSRLTRVEHTSLRHFPQNLLFTLSYLTYTSLYSLLACRYRWGSIWGRTDH